MMFLNFKIIFTFAFTVIGFCFSSPTLENSNNNIDIDGINNKKICMEITTKLYDIIKKENCISQQGSQRGFFNCYKKSCNHILWKYHNKLIERKCTHVNDKKITRRYIGISDQLVSCLFEKCENHYYQEKNNMKTSNVTLSTCSQQTRNACQFVCAYEGSGSCSCC